MGRKERPLEPGPLHDFAFDLRELRADTRMTYRAMARKAGYSASALSAAASGDMLPTLEVLLAYVAACGGDVAEWERRWQDLSTARSEPEPGSSVDPPDEELAPIADASEGRASKPEEPGGREPVPAAVASTDAAYLPFDAHVIVPMAPPPAPWPRPLEGLPVVRAAGASEIVPLPGDSVPVPGGKHRRNGHRRPKLTVQLGLVAIILATAAITVYSIMLPDSGENTSPATPRSTAPIIVLPAHSNGNQPASGSPVFLGAPGWNSYCEATGHGTVQLTGGDAYGWHCSDGSGIDGNAACAWTYGYPANRVIGRIQDFYDPNSWQCWRITTELGMPDFNGYCSATGQGTARLVSQNAYGWRCSADNGTGDDANAVCAWTYRYSSSRVTNRFQDFYDPNSWQCWA